jgi:hypothetical protein
VLKLCRLQHVKLMRFCFPVLVHAFRNRTEPLKHCCLISMSVVHFTLFFFLRIIVCPCGNIHRDSTHTHTPWRGWRCFRRPLKSTTTSLHHLKPMQVLEGSRKGYQYKIPETEQEDPASTTVAFPYPHTEVTYPYKGIVIFGSPGRASATIAQFLQ